MLTNTDIFGRIARQSPAEYASAIEKPRHGVMYRVIHFYDIIDWTMIVFAIALVILVAMGIV